jgi:glycosyltransferase involved in cell wall biosynthesis
MAGMAKKLLFITSVPSFYKNLLFSELEQITEISVFYTFRSPIKRNNDFFSYFKSNYILCQQNEGPVKKIIKLAKAARKADFIYYNGWDDFFFWFIIMISPIEKNILLLESSIYEYSDKGLRKKVLNRAKKFFLKRINCCIASGTPHGLLVKKLGFKGRIKYALGVGLMDFKYPPQIKDFRNNRTDSVKSFLFIGRIGMAKGINLILPVFMKNPDIYLHLVGDIDDDMTIAPRENIIFHGYQKRDDLVKFFQLCDVFILPSLIEPWGLVVEEALYHGLPALVSDKVGCNIDIVEKYKAGFVFKTSDPIEIEEVIREICKPGVYNSIVSNIALIDFNEIRNHYVQSIYSDFV